MRNTFLVAALLVACSKPKQVAEPQDGVHEGIVEDKREQKFTVRCEVTDAWAALVPTALYRRDEFLMQALIGLREEPSFWATTEYADLAPFAARRCSPEAEFVVANGSYKLVVGARERWDDAKGTYGINGVIRDVEIQGAAQAATIVETDLDVSWSCISCPRIYAWDGHEFLLRGEVLRDVIGAGAERSDRRRIGKVLVERGTVRLKLTEEEEEVSHVNALVLEVEGRSVRPDKASLVDDDADYATLHRGDELLLAYKVDLPDGEYDATVAATGYYVPLAPLH